jgi:hypothetical protein
MRIQVVTVLALAAVSGCAPASYLYSFDLTDPGAINYPDFRRPDVIEDPDVKLEVRADPTEFKAIALDVTNKTEVPLTVQWSLMSIIGPDAVQNPIRPQTDPGPIQPGAKVTALLVPFTLPSTGAAAKMYDGTTFELVVPLVVRGAPRESRYHLKVKLQKI